MTEPITFDDTTTRFALPLLYTGQAQKEAFVNEALSRIDTLLHCSIQGEATTPPPLPADGENWLIGSDPTGEWTDHAQHLACRQAGSWAFIPPIDGMRVFDLSTGQAILFFGFWKKCFAPLEPLGGEIVDGEARTAIVDLIASLRAIGIFPSP